MKQYKMSEMIDAVETAVDARCLELLAEIRHIEKNQKSTSDSVLMLLRNKLNLLKAGE